MEEQSSPAEQDVVEFHEKKKTNTSVFFVWTAFVLSLIFTGYMYISTKGIESVVEDKSAEKSLLLQEIDSSNYDEVESRAVAVKTAVETLTIIKDDKVNTEDLLGELYGFITSDVKLTSVALGADGSINLDGATGSYRQVADFMEGIKSYDRISDLELVSVAVSLETDAAINQKIVFSVKGVVDRQKTTVEASITGT